MNKPADNEEFYGFLLRLATLSTLMLLPMWVMLAVKWPMSNDILTFGDFLVHFSAQFWQGDWYPRWLMDANAGYGSPAFLYYSPLSYYIGNLFAWLAPYDPHGLCRISLEMQLALFCAGLSSYRWLKQHFLKLQAMQGALLYCGFPYLFDTIYYAYGVGQLFAIAIFPLVLMAIDNLRKASWRGMPPLAVAFSMLCLTHLPSLMIFIPVAVAYSVLTTPPKHCLRQLVVMGISGIAGMALSAIYLVPLVLNRPYIRGDHYVSGQFGYAANFYEPDLLFGFCLFILPLAALYLEQPKDRPPATPQAKTWFFITLLILFMTLPVSKFIWDMLPPLQYLQYPRRFYNAMLPGVVFIAVALLQQARSKRVYVYLWLFMLAYTGYTSWETWFTYDTTPMTSRPFIALGASSEYQTIWMDDTKISTQRMPSGPELAGIIEGEGNVQVLKWRPREIVLHADIASDKARLQLHRFYFPGWVGADVEPVHGLLTLPLTKGMHDITLTIPDFTGEALGRSISLVTAMLLLAWRRYGQS